MNATTILQWASATLSVLLTAFGPLIATEFVRLLRDKRILTLTTEQAAQLREATWRAIQYAEEQARKAAGTQSDIAKMTGSEKLAIAVETLRNSFPSVSVDTAKVYIESLLQSHRPRTSGPVAGI